MDLAITQALIGLIPSLEGHLQQELKDLTSALLAQSRSYAGSLKAEEEIARLYACANLACNRYLTKPPSKKAKLECYIRLKRELGLPKFNARPPCPPRIYQQLYRHFDSCLGAGTRRRGRLPKPRIDELPTNIEPLKHLKRSSDDRAEGDPSIQQKLLRQWSRSGIPDARNQNTKLPDWVMPSIHYLCRSTGASAAPPHVFVGISTAMSVFSSLLGTPNTPAGRANLLALLVAIYLNVSLRISNRKVDAQSLDAEARFALEVVTRLEEAHEAAPYVDVTDVHTWIIAFHEKAFLHMEWYQNVPRKGDFKALSTGLHTRNGGGLGLQSLRKQTLERTGKSTVLPGLGTMMQDRVDFVTQAKRADYISWKSNIMSRIQEINTEANTVTTT
ncbi:hypothetical protein MMC13_001179 [Lambiella insularis]|nr:hypothetical protein [Lambiella insularis]